MQTEPHCFHAKRLNSLSLNNIDTNFKSHVSSCPDCISKINSISSDEQEIESYFDSLNVSEQTLPLLKSELKEAIELARPKKAEAIKEGISHIQRSFIRDGIQFIKNFFVLRNALLLVFALSFILLSRLINT